MSNPIKKFIVSPRLSLSLCLLFFAQNVVLATTVESNIWAERKKGQSIPQIASVAHLLPTAPGPMSASTIDKVTAHHQLSQANKSKHLQSVFPLPLQAAVMPHAQVQEIYLPKHPSQKTLFLMQDAHLQAEAQLNIAGALKNLAQNFKEKGETEFLVGLEGADFKNNKVSRLQSYVHREPLKKMARAMLKKKMLTGSEMTVLVAEKDDPFVVTGIENESEYKANVQALQKTTHLKKQQKSALQSFHGLLTDLKNKHLNLSLVEFDQKKRAFQDGRLLFPDYAFYLDSKVPATSPEFKKMIPAFLLEKSLNFENIQREREKFLLELTKKMKEKELEELIQFSLHFKSQQLTARDYYRILKQKAKATNIKFSRYPDLQLYIQYVLLSESIDVSQFFVEVEEHEDQVVHSLIKNEKERSLIEIIRDSYILEKLIRHELTELEWNRYEERGKKLSQLSTKLEKLKIQVPPTVSKLLSSVESYEEFYHWAVKRNETMAERMIERLKKSDGRYGFMIVGGFHTQGILNHLKKQDLSVVVLSPKMTQVEEGPTSLDFLADNSRPLDQLFSGEKIFLPVESIFGTPAQSVAERALVAGSEALRTNSIRRVAGFQASPASSASPEPENGVRFEADGQLIDIESYREDPTQEPLARSAISWFNFWASVLLVPVGVYALSGVVSFQSNLGVFLFSSLGILAALIVHELGHWVEARMRGYSGKVMLLPGVLSGGISIKGSSGFSGVAASFVALFSSLIFAKASASWGILLSVSQLVFLVSFVISNVIYGLSLMDWEDMLSQKPEKNESDLPIIEEIESHIKKIDETNQSFQELHTRFRESVEAIQALETSSSEMVSLPELIEASIGYLYAMRDTRKRLEELGTETKALRRKVSDQLREQMQEGADLVSQLNTFERVWFSDSEQALNRLEYESEYTALKARHQFAIDRNIGRIKLLAESKNKIENFSQAPLPSESEVGPFQDLVRSVDDALKSRNEPTQEQESNSPDLDSFLTDEKIRQYNRAYYNGYIAPRVNHYVGDGSRDVSPEEASRFEEFMVNRALVGGLLVQERWGRQAVNPDYREEYQSFSPPLQQIVLSHGGGADDYQVFINQLKTIDGPDSIDRSHAILSQAFQVLDSQFRYSYDRWPVDQALASIKNQDPNHISEEKLLAADLGKWAAVKADPDLRSLYSEDKIETLNNFYLKGALHQLFDVENPGSMDQTRVVSKIADLRDPRSIPSLFLISLQGGHTARAAMESTRTLMRDPEFRAAFQETFHDKPNYLAIINELDRIDQQEREEDTESPMDINYTAQFAFEDPAIADTFLADIISNPPIESMRPYGIRALEHFQDSPLAIERAWDQGQRTLRSDFNISGESDLVSALIQLYNRRYKAFHLEEDLDRLFLLISKHGYKDELVDLQSLAGNERRKAEDSRFDQRSRREAQARFDQIKRKVEDLIETMEALSSEEVNVDLEISFYNLAAEVNLIDHPRAEASVVQIVRQFPYVIDIDEHYQIQKIIEDYLRRDVSRKRFVKVFKHIFKLANGDRSEEQTAVDAIFNKLESRRKKEVQKFKKLKADLKEVHDRFETDEERNSDPDYQRANRRLENHILDMDRTLEGLLQVIQIAAASAHARFHPYFSAYLAGTLNNRLSQLSDIVESFEYFRDPDAGWQSLVTKLTNLDYISSAQDRNREYTESLKVLIEAVRLDEMLMSEDRLLVFQRISDGIESASLDDIREKINQEKYVAIDHLLDQPIDRSIPLDFSPEIENALRWQNEHRNDGFRKALRLQIEIGHREGPDRGAEEAEKAIRELEGNQNFLSEENWLEGPSPWDVSAQPVSDLEHEYQRIVSEQRREMDNHIQLMEQNLQVRLEYQTAEDDQQTIDNIEAAVRSLQQENPRGPETNDLYRYLDQILQDIKNIRSVRSNLASLEPEEVTFYVSQDPAERLNLGVGFPSCLDCRDGGFRDHVISSVIDANKRVIFVRNKKGSRIARLTLAMGNGQILVTSRFYRNSSLSLVPHLATFLKKYEEKTGKQVVLPKGLLSDEEEADFIDAGFTFQQGSMLIPIDYAVADSFYTDFTGVVNMPTEAGSFMSLGQIIHFEEPTRGEFDLDGALVSRPSSDQSSLTDILAPFNFGERIQKQFSGLTALALVALYYLFIASWERLVFSGLLFGFEPGAYESLASVTPALGFIGINVALFLALHVAVRWLVRKRSGEWSGLWNEIKKEFIDTTDFSIPTSPQNQIHPLSQISRILLSRFSWSLIYGAFYAFLPWSPPEVMGFVIGLHFVRDVLGGFKVKNNLSPQQLKKLKKKEKRGKAPKIQKQGFFDKFAVITVLLLALGGGWVGATVGQWMSPETAIEQSIDSAKPLPNEELKKQSKALYEQGFQFLNKMAAELKDEEHPLADSIVEMIKKMENHYRNTGKPTIYLPHTDHIRAMIKPEVDENGKLRDLNFHINIGVLGGVMHRIEAIDNHLVENQISDPEQLSFFQGAADSYKNMLKANLVKEGTHYRNYKEDPSKAEQADREYSEFKSWQAQILAGKKLNESEQKKFKSLVQTLVSNQVHEETLGVLNYLIYLKSKGFTRDVNHVLTDLLDLKLSMNAGQPDRFSQTLEAHNRHWNSAFYNNDAGINIRVLKLAVLDMLFSAEYSSVGLEERKRSDQYLVAAPAWASHFEILDGHAKAFRVPTEVITVDGYDDPIPYPDYFGFLDELDPLTMEQVESPKENSPTEIKTEAQEKSPEKPETDLSHLIPLQKVLQDRFPGKRVVLSFDEGEVSFEADGTFAAATLAKLADQQNGLSTELNEAAELSKSNKVTLQTKPISELSVVNPILSQQMNVVYEEASPQQIWEVYKKIHSDPRNEGRPVTMPLLMTKTGFKQKLQQAQDDEFASNLLSVLDQSLLTVGLETLNVEENDDLQVTDPVTGELNGLVLSLVSDQYKTTLGLPQDQKVDILILSNQALNISHKDLYFSHLIVQVLIALPVSVVGIGQRLKKSLLVFIQA